MRLKKFPELQSPSEPVFKGGQLHVTGMGRSSSSVGVMHSISRDYFSMRFPKCMSP